MTTGGAPGASARAFVGRPASYVTLRPRPDAKVRLVCFPYAGGGASVYQPWIATLPTSVEVVAAQYPGRETRSGDALCTALDALVESLLSELRLKLEKPWVAFGHSMGALVAFEVVRRLHERYRIKPEHLFVSGAGAPHVRQPEPISHLTEVAFLRALIRLNGMPREVLSSPELLAYALPILRADFTACEGYAYRAGPPLPCPVTVFGGEHDPRVDVRRLEAWSAHASVHFCLKMLPGDHFFLRRSQSRLLQALLDDLRPLLTSTSMECK